MELGKIIVHVSDTKQRKQVKQSVEQQLKGIVCLDKCQIIFESNFVQGNSDTAKHVSQQKLYNRLSKVNDPYAILVVSPNISKKTILTASQLMRSQDFESKDIGIGCTAIINKDGVKYMSY